MAYITPDLKLVGRAAGIVVGTPLPAFTPDRIAGIPDPPAIFRYTSDRVLDFDDGF